ncbi:MAG: hypothetical protein A2Z21_07395 [Candidatus Fraserbacteria bacterium RBG_16_55_9]|uniref:DinB-like domain-containing protein n=1 Tax=Fraserbacteria sp. (strain RBG_16_55_9) TaxID=1817864 RepID=A0A1F5V0I6_FRAXR|nr:MAG: hypothetical protein A2Z21_07395 [Candidatus Fraserbacteria bacterium RBG_16_55_9]
MTKKHLDVKPAKGTDPQLGMLTAMLEDGTREWREELGEVPDDAVVWQPFPNGHSIGAILLHIADVEVHWIETVAAGKPRSPEELKLFLSDETDQEAVQWPKPPARPLLYYFELHNGVRQRTLKTLKQFNNPEQISARQRRDGSSWEFTLRWILHHVITHEAYHGGQAVLLSLEYSRRKST